jgi:hypothetical protein
MMNTPLLEREQTVLSIIPADKDGPIPELNIYETLKTNFLDQDDCARVLNHLWESQLIGRKMIDGQRCWHLPPGVKPSLAAIANAPIPKSSSLPRQSNTLGKHWEVGRARQKQDMIMMVLKREQRALTSGELQEFTGIINVDYHLKKLIARGLVSRAPTKNSVVLEALNWRTDASGRAYVPKEEIPESVLPLFQNAKSNITAGALIYHITLDGEMRRYKQQGHKPSQLRLLYTLTPSDEASKQ